MELSYIYASYYLLWNLGWNIFSMAGLMALLTVGWMIVISPILRALFWLPSFIFWAVSADEYNFWLWLAPGFFIKGG